MRLNQLSGASGSKKAAKRVGRGIGSGIGKTCGRGHKGQKSRAGGFHKVGFEGGQMPLQRRLPKVGFRSRKARFSVEIRLGELDSLGEDVIDMALLRRAGLVAARARRVKIIRSGALSRPLTVVGVSASSGAREAIEAAGGTIDVGAEVEN